MEFTCLQIFLLVLFIYFFFAYHFHNNAVAFGSSWSTRQTAFMLNTQFQFSSLEFALKELNYCLQVENAWQ